MLKNTNVIDKRNYRKENTLQVINCYRKFLDNLSVTAMEGRVTKFQISYRLRLISVAFLTLSKREELLRKMLFVTVYGNPSMFSLEKNKMCKIRDRKRANEKDIFPLAQLFVFGRADFIKVFIFFILIITE